MVHFLYYFSLFTLILKTHVVLLTFFDNGIITSIYPNFNIKMQNTIIDGWMDGEYCMWAKFRFGWMSSPGDFVVASRKRAGDGNLCCEPWLIIGKHQWGVVGTLTCVGKPQFQVWCPWSRGSFHTCTVNVGWIKRKSQIVRTKWGRFENPSHLAITKQQQLCKARQKEKASKLHWTYSRFIRKLESWL